MHLSELRLRFSGIIEYVYPYKGVTQLQLILIIHASCYVQQSKMSTFTESLFLAICQKSSINAKYGNSIQTNYLLYVRYASAFRHWMHRILVCPSVQHASILPFVQLTNAQVTYQPTDFPSIRVSVCLPIRPERFPWICTGTHGWTGRELGMLIYPDHRQNWLGFGHIDFPTFGTTLT